MDPVKRVLEQTRAFNEVTVECSRCHHQAALAHVNPTPRGLYCDRCIVSMPRHELDALTREGDTLASQHRR